VTLSLVKREKLGGHVGSAVQLMVENTSCCSVRLSGVWRVGGAAIRHPWLCAGGHLSRCL